MAAVSRHDAWQAGDRYEAYMGRWSRKVAPQFLDWVGASAGRDWLDVGCGTGALSASIIERCSPASVIGIDPSESFVAAARSALADPRAEFRVGDAAALPLESACRDVVASALVLNFVPDRQSALHEFARVVRPGGTIAFYVWDYPGDGIELLGAFWAAASALDPSAFDLAENKRFAFCTPDGLTGLARAAGLAGIECAAIEIATRFRDFDDYWRPFTLGAGPAPGYCASLPAEARERLRLRLEGTLPRAADGSISLSARAWAVKATVG